jgi:predicted CopG family antitoxin
VVFQIVKIISISDEVYNDLTRLKNGKSFTELLKTLIIDATNKGDPKSILHFLNANESLPDEAADEIASEIEASRKNTNPRKSAEFA